ncbi:hypothetical protein C3E79_00445 [Corynebacterium liangguodongii]|uniref:LGFP repeat-containing protein n=3 Tax=Corynebacterium liangguodongii TaxID=2079535 RepID=A0A2S0WH13_9CORY|nr:hypothetical protein C3E79_00445 [Corynebacterium liangguodongii]
MAAHPTAATAQTASSGSSLHDGISPPETNEGQPIPDTAGEPIAVPLEGPFAEWGIPTPPGAEGYEVNQVTQEELNPQGLDQWHPTNDPQSEIIPGQMRSDKEEVPAGVSKADADQAEVKEARLTSPDTPTLNARPGCSVYWPAPFEVCGAIKNLYDSIGGPTSFLLLPKSNELVNPDGVGRRSEFVNGFIYWHPRTGAHSVSIPVSTVWQRHGWENGFLGYPTTSDISLGNQWYVQHFEGGHVYTHNALPATQASIQGAIYDKWQSMGGHNSDLGFPISDELTTPDGIGRYNVFEGGMIYWTPQHGAHPVTDPVLLDWAAAGYEKSSYGYPTGDPKDEGVSVTQDFEGGTLESFKVEEMPGGALIGTIPYLEFPSDQLAAEFFDRVEAGLESIPKPDSVSLQAAGKRYGPCELSIDSPHARKSSAFNAVGFKPRTKCSERVLKVMHTNTLRYKYFATWRKAPNLRGRYDPAPDYKYNQNSSLPYEYSTLDLEQDCAGRGVETLFVGVTEGKIVTTTGTFYARVYSKPSRVGCKIPGND